MSMFLKVLLVQDCEEASRASTGREYCTYQWDRQKIGLLLRRPGIPSSCAGRWIAKPGSLRRFSFGIIHGLNLRRT